MNQVKKVILDENMSQNRDRTDSFRGIGSVCKMSFRQKRSNFESIEKLCTQGNQVKKVGLEKKMIWKTDRPDLNGEKERQE